MRAGYQFRLVRLLASVNAGLSLLFFLLLLDNRFGQVCLQVMCFDDRQVCCEYTGYGLGAYVLSRLLV